MELLSGTIKFEGTDNAVTKKQAGILLPLWKNYKTLSRITFPARGCSGQAAVEAALQVTNGHPHLENQMDDLVEQIKSALTSDQLQAIFDTEITHETSRTVPEEFGISIGIQQGNGGKPEGAKPLQGNGGDSGDDQATQETKVTGGPSVNGNGMSSD